MANAKEIRNKIRSVQSTRKITKAMEMVAASKMRKAQERMRASRPYLLRVFQIAINIAHANTEYHHPFLARREKVRRVGAIVVTTDKGLCGGLNTNVLRLVLQQHKAWRAQDIDVDYAVIGTRGQGFLQRMGANIVSTVTYLGERPHLERLVGAAKLMMDAYVDERIDELHVFYTTFVNTMRQEARHGLMLPIPAEFRSHFGDVRAQAAERTWDYIYEPEARDLLDGLLRRYVEATVFQMTNENSASEQSARMVAMKAASDNAENIIDELQLIYNKTRQAAITKELSEIVGGAAAV